jgi:hypothetical protein
MGAFTNRKMQEPVNSWTATAKENDISEVVYRETFLKKFCEKNLLNIELASSWHVIK